MLRLMGNLPKLIWCFVIGLFRSRDALEAEIVALRHQLNVLRRKAPKRLVFSNCDRFDFTCLYRLVPGILNTLVIVSRRRSSTGIGVEGLPAEPRRWNCRNGSLCRSDAFLSAALWFADSLARL